MAGSADQNHHGTRYDTIGATIPESQVRIDMSKIPQFANEQEEADFWATHDATDYLNETEPEQVAFVDARPPKKQISLRLDPDVIDRLKAISGQKGIGYQTLIRMWVMERLAQESG
jgi:predicted DNA binding CopG/RHH family protein